MNYFRNCCSTLINAVLPQRCALCRAATGCAAPICAQCENLLPRLPTQRCPRCADFSAANAICGHCLRTPPAFDAVLSPFLYAEPVDTLIHRLKYQHQLRLAAWLGERLAVSIAGAPAAIDVDAIIPLPLHPERMKTRGFNQAIEISRPVAARLQKPVLRSAAFRIRDTAPQASLKRIDRQRNIDGAFECHVDLSGKSILIIDDVLTTGSSANELARVLKLHGARRVLIGVAARTHQG